MSSHFVLSSTVLSLDFMWAFIDCLFFSIYVRADGTPAWYTQQRSQHKYRAPQKLSYILIAFRGSTTWNCTGNTSTHIPCAERIQLFFIILTFTYNVHFSKNFTGYFIYLIFWNDRFSTIQLLPSPLIIIHIVPASERWFVVWFIFSG